ncbi:hypothetical protein NIES4074_23440 [Cylindrospermum sp. NIES-4074]|nr:hypothetical protein NIES4074_23440 [Cylindrospermum sp. NIES-4074]
MYYIQIALAIEVVAGGYTAVLIPLFKSYTLSGVITDAQSEPISGARVEAIHTTSQQRSFSVTNDAGICYLDRLQKGKYIIYINGKNISILINAHFPAL